MDRYPAPARLVIVLGAALICWVVVLSMADLITHASRAFKWI